MTTLEALKAKYAEQNPQRDGREPPLSDTIVALCAVLDDRSKKGRVADLARAGLDRLLKR